jgi:hypothetical protein
MHNFSSGRTNPLLTFLLNLYTVLRDEEVRQFTGFGRISVRNRSAQGTGKLEENIQQMNRPKQGGLDSDAGHSMALASKRIHSEGREMNKQSSKSSRSATSASAPAGRASFARLVSHLIPAFGLAPLAGALGGLLLGESASPLLTALLPLKTAHANTIYNTDRLTFSAGDNHACGIRNGALYCWGDNSYGQSGTGGTTTPVPNMTSGVTAVDAGAYHTCAIRNGALLCWGYNNRGQLGDGTTTNRTTPVTVTNMISNVVAAAAEGWHSCAIRNGALLCWGGGGWSGPGGSYGSIPPWGSVPVTVSGMVNGVTNVTAGH